MWGRHDVRRAADILLEPCDHANNRHRTMHVEHSGAGRLNSKRFQAQILNDANSTVFVGYEATDFTAL